ncbi:uncharacterized protein LOC142562013 isoform X1 [Dermacentor variabilis]|uniref:uncharacterized protein LOC142562013 isoform X1 n=1 Tax=Dermacentor variabilis TaxID=34621 RepID=UPI003F5B6EAF
MSKAWEFNCPKYFDFELGDEENAPSAEEYFESHKDSPLRRRQALRTVDTTHLKPVKPTTTPFENGHKKLPAPTTKCLEKARCKGKCSKPATSVHVAMGAGSGGNFLWSIFWLIVLIILSVPVAGICAFLYIIVSIFTPCIAPLKSLEDLLHKGVNFPHTCSQNMVHGSSL